MAWQIKMHPSTAFLLMKQSKVTWHKQSIMCNQQTPSQYQKHNHQPSFRPALSPHQPYPLRAHMRSTAGRLPNQIFTLMTQDAFPSELAVETSMLLSHFIVTATLSCRIRSCSGHFHKCTITIYDPQGLPLLQGRRYNKGAKLWRSSLSPQSSTPSWNMDRR